MSAGAPRAVSEDRPGRCRKMLILSELLVRRPANLKGSKTTTNTVDFKKIKE
jgi:hypothetical protein